MRTDTMRPAPRVFASSLASSGRADPVRRYRPGAAPSSTARRTASQTPGTRCHSSMSTGESASSGTLRYTQSSVDERPALSIRWLVQFAVRQQPARRLTRLCWALCCATMSDYRIHGGERPAPRRTPTPKRLALSPSAGTMISSVMPRCVHSWTRSVVTRDGVLPAKRLNAIPS